MQTLPWPKDEVDNDTDNSDFLPLPPLVTNEDSNDCYQNYPYPDPETGLVINTEKTTSPHAVQEGCRPVREDQHFKSTNTK